MVNAIRCRISYVYPHVDHVFCLFLICLLSFAASPASAQELPSNVYRPPADNFNRAPQRVTYPQGQVYQQGQTLQTVPQYQTIPGRQQFYYPQQNPTPIYQQPIQGVQGALVPQQAQPAPAVNSAETVELKRSLVKARDLMQKYQLKLEDVARKNQELESEIATLRQPGDMGDLGDSKELVAAKAAASKAQQQMFALEQQLSKALMDAQTSTADLERQKQMGAELKQEVAELQKSVRMAAGGDEKVAELTKGIQQFKMQNDELDAKVTDLQNALREKETRIANMGSGDDAKLADLKELLTESENSNQQLSLRLKKAEAKAAEMTAPQTDPALDQLRADNQTLVQQNGQLESKNNQLNDMLENLRSQNSDLDATVTRLSSMAPPVEAAGFAAASPSPDLTGLQNQLASVTRRNGQLERQLKNSKSKYTSLEAENARLSKEANSESPIEVAAAPAVVKPVALDAAPVTAVVPELGLNSVSGGWPVKYWIFGMLGVGLAVGLGVAWYESVVDPKGLRRSTSSVSNH